MNPAPLHLRLVESGDSKKWRIYSQGNLVAEVEDSELEPADLCRVFTDTYGMPISLDVSTSDVEQPSVITGDHLDEELAIVFDAINYPSVVLENMGKQMVSRSLTLKLIEASQLIKLPRDNIPEALRIADNPNAYGTERIYALQGGIAGINPRFAQFGAIMSWLPDSPRFVIEFGEIEVHEGEFGRGGIIQLGQQ